MTDNDDLTPADQQFARAASELLRDSADGLDAATASKLNRARQAALAQLPGRKSAATRPGWLLPAASAAAVAALVVGVWFNVGRGPAVGAGAVADASADVEILLADESLDMIEDLEFYNWADESLSAEQLQAELEAVG